MKKGEQVIVNNQIVEWITQMKSIRKSKYFPSSNAWIIELTLNVDLRISEKEMEDEIEKILNKK